MGLLTERREGRGLITGRIFFFFFYSMAVQRVVRGQYVTRDTVLCYPRRYFKRKKKSCNTFPSKAETKL